MALTNELALARIEQKGAHFIKSSETSYDGMLCVESTREQIIDFLLSKHTYLGEKLLS